MVGDTAGHPVNFALLVRTGRSHLESVCGRAPSLLVRLNRDTGATALGEYALLLQLEAVARGEITHLLDSVNLLAPAGARGR